MDETLEYSLFVGHVHMKHAGAGWNAFYALQCHRYKIPRKAVFKEAAVFSYAALHVSDSTFSIIEITISGRR